MKSLRSEKGAITLITLITILFLVSFLITSYLLVSNKVKTQKEILSETKKIYEPKTTMEEIYNSYFTNDDIIPIYTVEQLLAIGNDETININGKVYTFSNTKNTAYLLKNDLEFSAIDLNLEDDWIPPYQNEDLLANFDWSGHTIKVTKLNGNVITYDGTYLATITGNPLILKNSVKGNLLDYKIYGNSIQNGDPSPSTPVEIQSVGNKSKNIIEYPYYDTTKTINGITYTDNGDGTITANGTATANATFNIETNRTNVWEGVQAGETYTVSLETNSNYDGNTTGVSYVVNYYPVGAASGASYYGWMSVGVGASKNSKCPDDIAGIRSYLLITKGTTVENIVLKPKLETGTKATGYEPYGKYKIPIKVTGKNKYFNSSNRDTTSSYGVNIKNQIGNSDFTITGTANTSGNLLGSVGNILKPGNYKIKLEGDNKLDSYYLQVSTDNSTWTNKLLQLQPNNVYSFTITELSYVRIGIKIVKDEQYDSNYKVLIRDDDINISDSYEQYREQIFNIYLDEPLRKVGNYADYIDFEKQKIYREVKVIDNTGTMSIESSYQGMDTIEETTIELPDISILKGINSIEVDTQVQPSNISVTYNAKQ